jgi:hypothetical protein
MPFIFMLGPLHAVSTHPHRNIARNGRQTAHLAYHNPNPGLGYDRAMLHDSLSSALLESLESQATNCNRAATPTAAAASGETGVSLGTCIAVAPVRFRRLKHRAVPS